MGDCPRELKRIIPTQITTEKTQSGSWFSAGAKSPEPIPHETSGHPAHRDGKMPSVQHQTKHSNTNGAYSQNSDLSNAMGFTTNHMSRNNSTNGRAFQRQESSSRVDSSDTVSEASYSSELEMEKYLQTPLLAAGISTNYQLESEEFLRSLPPIKPINLDAYATLPLLPQRSTRWKQESMSDKYKKTKLKEKKMDAKNKESFQSNLGELTPIRSPDSASSSSTFVVSPLSSFESSTGSSFSFFSTPDPKTGSQQTSSPVQNTTLVMSDQNSSVYHSALSSGDSMVVNSLNKKQFDDVLKEKAKLQGQLEILTEESQSMLKVK